MNEPGYIYVMTNPSMEGLVKIGKTTREPESRAKELSQATGVATPFYAAFSIYVSDCDAAEEFVHALLDHSGFRHTANREFFQISLRKAIEVLLLAENQFVPSDSSEGRGGSDGAHGRGSGFLNAGEPSADDHPGRAVFEEAIDTYFGVGDLIEDQKEAVRLLFQAKTLNYPAAYTSLAQLFRDEANHLESTHDKSSSQRAALEFEKALDVLKDGAAKGHGFCWLMMAEMYLLGEVREDRKPDPDSANKCWKRFFRSGAHTKASRYDSLPAPASGRFDFFAAFEEKLPRGCSIRSYLRLLAENGIALDPDIRQILLASRERVLGEIASDLAVWEQAGRWDLVKMFRDELDLVEKKL